MLTAENCFCEMLTSPVRRNRARVELLEGSTLLDVFKHTDSLKSFTVERIGGEKFFGYGICHKATIKLLDAERKYNITTANALDISYGSGCDFIYPHPYFYVSQVRRDEKTNELSITAYDALYKAAAHTAAEMNITFPATIADYATQAAALLGLNCVFTGFADEGILNTQYETGANLDGTETIRAVLDAIAEATQTIYFVDYEHRIVFKRLDKDGEAVWSITKDDYYTLENSTNRRLAAICSATELGDNVEAKLTITGTTQYVRDNPFYEMRDDLHTMLETALEAVGGLTINQFNCEWRGNYLLEIGDKLALTTKDGGIEYSYMLDDVIEYDGAYKQKTKWKYADTDNETAANPTNLGEALYKTFARVDKVNKQIELVASETTTNTEDIANIYLNTSGIQASVNRIETTTNAAIGAMNGELATLTQKVNASITAEDVRIEVQSQLDNGIDKITTNTGYTFDDEGLTVSKTGSEMTTQITEDGMTVSRDNTALLTANNAGVVATNLHANTYLWIGKYSRFEDYEANGARTGCFWVGGA